MKKPKNVVILGATGSIGRNAVREVLEHPKEFSVSCVAANSSVSELVQTAVKLDCHKVITGSPEYYPQLKELLPPGFTASCGIEAMCEAVSAPEVDVVLCAIIGTAGIKPVISALRAGKKVALASKEVLCLAGELVMAEAARSPGGCLVPVDSEHSGLFQCLAGHPGKQVKKLILTASGGPFRTWEKEQIRTAAVEQALRHPTWSMGKKITIDSASMMNKALEVVEASFLFQVPGEKISVLVHPQSVVHALVQWCDNSVISQWSVPDMRAAIRYGLSYPDRLAGSVPELDCRMMSSLEFFPVDEEKFPAIKLAQYALASGGTMPCVMNAANEVAVEAFCSGRIPFGKIWEVVRTAMESHQTVHNASLEEILKIDQHSRSAAYTLTV